MNKKLISFDENSLKILNDLADAKGTSGSEIVRRLLNMYEGLDIEHAKLIAFDNKNINIMSKTMPPMSHGSSMMMYSTSKDLTTKKLEMSVVYIDDNDLEFNVKMDRSDI